MLPLTQQQQSLNILHEAEESAAEFNRSVLQDAIKVVALDEVFSQRSPVFTGIDLATGYVFMAEHHESRSGKEWSAALSAKKAQGLDLETVVKDAGTGLAAGTSDAFPGAQQRDDSFHMVYKMGKVLFWLGKRAWAAMEALIEAEENLAKAKANGGPHYRESQRYRRAREHYEKIVWRHDAFEMLCEETRDAIEFVGLESTTIRIGEEQKEKLIAISEQMLLLGGKKIRQLAKYLKNRAKGLAYYMDDLREMLEEVSLREGEEVVVECCKLWRRIKELTRANKWLKRPHEKAIVKCSECIIELSGKRATEITKEVFDVIDKRYRASSAVEGFHSHLRPHLYVHKRVSQGFLELFTAWRNLRTRPMGKYKGTSAYELLNGEKFDDWLTMLGYPPSSLNH